MVTKRERNKFRQEIKIAENVVETQENKMWNKTKEFYKGNQYPHIDTDKNFDKMAVNLIFSNVASQLPSLTFTAPEYEVNPPTAEAMLNPNKARTKELRAKIMQKILNKQRQKQEFRKHFQLATLDSLLSLGILKTYVKKIKAPNPKAGETVIDFDTNKPVMEDGEPVKEPEKVTVDTKYKVNRVRPENFLIDPRAGNFLESADWMAEKIFMPTSEARKRFNDSDIPSVKKIDKDIKGDSLNYSSPVRGIDEKQEEELNMSVIYEVWDTKQKRKFYMSRNVQDKAYKSSRIPDSYTDFEDDSPYVPIKHHEIPDQFYPLPDIHPQIQIQQSYNKARNDVNDYRDQFKQKFFIQSGALDPDEEQKLSSSKLGEIIRMDQNPNTNMPVASVPQPSSVPSQIVQSLQLDKQDLQEVSGITELQRGGRDTQGQKATQSILANQSSQAKMNWKLMHITNAANKVGNKLLKLIQNNKKIGGVLKIEGGERLAGEDREARKNFIRFTPNDLQGEFDVEAKWGSSRPNNKQGEKQEFMEAMRLISSFPQILQHMDSRELAKEFAKHFPFSQRVMSQRPQTEEAFRNQGGGANDSEDQGEAGRTNSRTTPNPRTSQQGIQDVQDQIRGGIG